MAVPLMPVGGRIVFVTSHQAHFFPHKAVPMGYTARLNTLNTPNGLRTSPSVVYVQFPIATAGHHDILCAQRRLTERVSVEPPDPSPGGRALVSFQSQIAADLPLQALRDVLSHGRIAPNVRTYLSGMMNKRMGRSS